MRFFDSAIKHIHLIGIGGISMSAIAKILHHEGYTVSGSDFQDSHLLQELKSQGMIVYPSHEASQIEGAHMLIYSSAISADNPELLQAKHLGLPIMTRSQFLGFLTRQFVHSIAISGTHGKTTTTTMTAALLRDTPLDPIVLVGAEVESFGGNLLLGRGETIINEACEYKRSFLDFDYNLGVILNIEADHLDYFSDLDEIKETFITFANGARKPAVMVLNMDDPVVRSIRDAISPMVITYSMKEEADVHLENLSYDQGYPRYDLYYNGQFVRTIKLSMPGEHNVSNSLAAIASALCLIDEPDYQALEQLTGPKRRLERRGSYAGAILFEDYAHHPSEIKTSLKTLRTMFKDRELITVFQPHTYTRTHSLLREFSESFDDADQVILTPIYAAREKNTLDIHSEDLQKLLVERGVHAHYHQDLHELALSLKEELSPEKVLVVMGAGDIYHLFDELKEESCD